MVVTETRRADSTWILDGQVTDRSTLSDELAQFCAKYSIYHVKETRDSLSVIRNQAEGETTKLLGDILLINQNKIDILMANWGPTSTLNSILVLRKFSPWICEGILNLIAIYALSRLCHHSVSSLGLIHSHPVDIL